MCQAVGFQGIKPSGLTSHWRRIKKQIKRLKRETRDATHAIFGITSICLPRRLPARPSWGSHWSLPLTSQEARPGATNHGPLRELRLSVSSRQTGNANRFLGRKTFHFFRPRGYSPARAHSAPQPTLRGGTGRAAHPEWRRTRGRRAGWDVTSGALPRGALWVAGRGLLATMMAGDVGGRSCPDSELLLHPELLSQEFLLLTLEQVRRAGAGGPAWGRRWDLSSPRGVLGGAGHTRRRRACRWVEPLSAPLGPAGSPHYPVRERDVLRISGTPGS